MESVFYAIKKNELVKLSIENIIYGAYNKQIILPYPKLIAKLKKDGGHAINITDGYVYKLKKKYRNSKIGFHCTIFTQINFI